MMKGWWIVFCAVFTCEQPDAWLIYTVHRDKDWVETVPTSFAYQTHEPQCPEYRAYWETPRYFYCPTQRPVIRPIPDRRIRPQNWCCGAFERTQTSNLTPFIFMGAPATLAGNAA